MLVHLIVDRLWIRHWINMRRITPEEEEIYQAILQLQTVEECNAFFQDLCTPAEIKAISERFKVAQLLDEKSLSYREIHDKTGASLATIGRVARFLTLETYQGYRLILDRLKCPRIKQGGKC